MRKLIKRKFNLLKENDRLRREIKDLQREIRVLRDLLVLGKAIREMDETED